MKGIYYTPQAMADSTNVTISTVRKAIKERKVETIHADGRRILIPEDSPRAQAWLIEAGTNWRDETLRLRKELAKVQEQLDSARKEAEQERRALEAADLKAQQETQAHMTDLANLSQRLVTLGTQFADQSSRLIALEEQRHQ